MSSDNLPFTMATIMEQCGGSKSTAVMVLEEFLNQVPTDVGDMERSLASGDLLSASKAAHRLKGTAGVLGAVRLHPLCADMELTSKGGDVAKAAEIFAQLKAEAQVCVDAVPRGLELLS